MPFTNGVTALGTAPVPICTPGSAGVLLNNLSGIAIYVGGPGVTADATLTGGIPLGTASALIPVIGRRGYMGGFTPADTNDALYGRTAAGSASVAWLTTT